VTARIVRLLSENGGSYRADEHMTVTDERATAAQPAYVAGLDGLRAVAIVAVMIYHFAPSTLPAGFLGVDVFFVVSGFLISRLVVAEITGTNHLRLGHFWARRARRLLPALGTMTIVVLIAVAIASTDAERHDIRGQAIGTLFYFANWVMIYAKNSYFASIGRPSPFLHMWTLAVEEQFYLVFPLVCFAARRWIVRFPVRAAIVALVGAVVSTVWMAALVSPTGDPSRAYLGSDSHAMGLLVGVALGVLAGAGRPWEAMAARLRANAQAARLAAAVGLGALLAILVTMRVVDGYTYALYRGGFLAFALLCGAIIVVVVTLPATRVAQMLSAPWVVAVGLRSYSLYLWHWPVRVFISPSSGIDGPALFVVRSAVTIVLAELSYRLVERPFRVGAVARHSGSRGAVMYFGGITAVAVLLVTTVADPVALPPGDLAHAAAAAQRHAPSTVPRPDSLPPRRVDIFGDSTALVFGISGANHAQELNITVGGDARLGCGIVPDDHESQGRVVANLEECDGWQARWRATLRLDPHAVVALMTGAWDILDQRTNAGVVKFGTQQWTDLVTLSLRGALQVLTADGRRVQLFEVPCYGVADANFPLPERADPKRIAALNRIFGAVAQEMPRVELVPWRTLVCPGGHRVETLHGVRLWKSDHVHLTEQGGVLVWKWWLSRLRAPQ
jgi:peptidoglycan/LPS O-acetylase OafA/YrhL